MIDSILEGGKVKLKLLQITFFAIILSFGTFLSTQAEMVNYWGFTQLYDAVMNQDPGKVDRLLKNGADVNYQFPNVKEAPSGYEGRAPLYQAVVSKDKKVEIIHSLLEHGADPTLKNVKGVSPLSLTAGYRIPSVRNTRNHSSGWLHQLMLSYVDDPSKLDDAMKWQGKGCYGYTVERTDTRLSYIARKVYGYPDRWRELARLNNISKDNPYKVGDCLKVFDVEW